MEYSLEMKDISKYFFGVGVLHNVNFHVRPGTVHALCGENGAGKSTLMKILAGIYSCESGTILINGKETVMRNPADAIGQGIAMIQQELVPIKDMKVSENIFLGREPGKSGLVNYRKMNQEAGELLQKLNCQIDVNKKMRFLRVADMQLVEIAKAILYDSKILIMDEPTSALTDREIKILFDVIEKLKKQGKAIVYISHKMDEIFAISDEITVLRDGQFIGNWQKEQFDIDNILFSMVGRRLDTIYPLRDPKIGEVVFQVQDLCKHKKYHNINFDVKRGEILGISGLMGSGRTEVMESLFGVSKYDSGQILYKGQPVQFSHPSEAYNAGIAFVTEDRKKYGLFPSMSVMQNITIACMRLITKLKAVIVSRREKEVSKKIYGDLHIKSKNLKQAMKGLSGGNQQKTVIARALLTNPDLLILDEPTRGIDVGAKHEIYNIMNEFCNSGKSIIFISSELPELLGMSDRILVFSNKTVAGELNKKDFDQKKFLNMAMSNL